MIMKAVFGSGGVVKSNLHKQGHVGTYATKQAIIVIHKFTYLPVEWKAHRICSAWTWPVKLLVSWNDENKQQIISNNHDGCASIGLITQVGTSISMSVHVVIRMIPQVWGYRGTYQILYMVTSSEDYRMFHACSHIGSLFVQQPQLKIFTSSVENGATCQLHQNSMGGFQCYSVVWRKCS